MSRSRLVARRTLDTSAPAISAVLALGVGATLEPRS